MSDFADKLNKQKRAWGERLGFQQFITLDDSDFHLVGYASAQGIRVYCTFSTGIEAGVPRSCDINVHITTLSPEEFREKRRNYSPDENPIGELTFISDYSSPDTLKLHRVWKGNPVFLRALCHVLPIPAESFHADPKQCLNNYAAKDPENSAEFVPVVHGMVTNLKEGVLFAPLAYCVQQGAVTPRPAGNNYS